MYCEKCGKYYSKDMVYCEVCGEKLVAKNKKQPTGKKKKTWLIVLIIAVCFSLIIGSTIFLFSSIVNWYDEIKVMSYIEMGNDKIPTMYLVDSRITMSEYEKELDNGNTTITAEYYYNLYNYDMINKYTDYLEENGFTYVENSSTDWYVVKKSVDNGMILIINIYEENDDDTSFSVVYEKIKGNINDYVEEVTYKQVGEEKYGYINIDSTWEPYLDKDDMLQYVSKDNYESLTIFYVEELSFTLREYMTKLQEYAMEDGASDLKITEVKVNNYDAYQMEGYYNEDNTYIVVWCFVDENNTLHYIEIDSNKYNSKTFSLIESYTLVK